MKKVNKNSSTREYTEFVVLYFGSLLIKCKGTSSPWTKRRGFYWLQQSKKISRNSFINTITYTYIRKGGKECVYHRMICTKI